MHCAFAQQSIDSLGHYYKLTINPKTNKDLLRALAFFDNHKEIALTNKDTLAAVYDLRTIAIIQNKIGALNNSENSAIEALKILDKYKFNDSIKIEPRLGLYNHLGKVLRELRQYDRAMGYYNKARENATTSKEFITLDNNVANTYMKLEKYDLAINYFSKAYNESIKISDTLSIARAQSNLGVAQFEIGDSKALYNLESALKLRKEKSYLDGIFTSYLHLSTYYKRKNNKDKALFFARKAKRIADSTGSTKQNINALSVLVDLKIDRDVIEYKKLSDSLSISERLLKNEDASYKYDLDKLKGLAGDYLLKSEDQKKQKEFFQILIALLLPTIVYTYYILKSKHKKKTLQEVYNTESHISKKVHDEVANDVFQVMTMLQGNTSVSEKVIDDLDHIYDKTRNIAKVHSVLDYEGDFKDTLNDLLLSYDNEMTRVIVKDIAKINWEATSKMKKQTIYKVLQELMVNMKKHSEAEIVALTFKTIRKKIAITYSDDGVGTNLKKSTGLQNVENRIKSIKGTIIFESEINKGFKSKITV